MLTRTDPFSPPVELCDTTPIQRMAFADGHVGWLVSSHRLVRNVLADPRFSNRQELLHWPYLARNDMRFPPGFFLRLDPPEHTRYRRLLTSQFTVRRMNALEPYLRQIVDEHLDALPEQADLVRHFTLPVPSLVICELLGVAYADRAEFQQASVTILDLDAPPPDRAAAMNGLVAFLRELSVHKRAHPGDDILSGLTGELTDDELTGIASLLLIAGHETVASTMALAAYRLLLHPEERADLHTEAAVDELLRHLSVVFMIVRAALEDVEIDGHLVERGHTVALNLAGANRDVHRFAEPDELDLTRKASGHLAFGHGVHQCLGHQLARVELRVALPALFERYPDLALAGDVPLKTNTSIYGVHRLPVTRG